MDSTEFAYKKDIYGNDIYLRVGWSSPSVNALRPVALIYHAGGIVTGNFNTIPNAQISHLTSAGYIVVMPNYRLAPQVSAKEAFRDSEEAFDWALHTLPGLLANQHQIHLDPTRVVAMGHSSGGTMVLHLVSIGKPIKAVLALYPFLFVSDPTTNATKPAGPEFFSASHSPSAPLHLTPDDWSLITPSNVQISSAPLRLPPSGDPTPRERWVMDLFRTGRWMTTLQPDAYFAAIDPMTRISESWPPVRIIHGGEDNAPGRSAALMRRAEREMRERGVRDVGVEIVEGGVHLFDHVPGLDGEKWEIVERGLVWLEGKA